MNLADTIGKGLLSAIIKQGIFYEARNLDLDGSLPIDFGGRTSELKFSIKVEHMALSLPAATDVGDKDLVLIRTLVAAQMKQLRAGSILLREAEADPAAQEKKRPWRLRAAKDGTESPAAEGGLK